MAASRRNDVRWNALALTVVLAAVGVSAGSARAQPTHEIPQSIQLEHVEMVGQLEDLAKRPAPVGPEAAKALELVQRHQQRESEYILPPLTLLPALAEGRVSRDMRWAIEMAEKVKANRAEIFLEHARITDAMNALLAAAESSSDTDAVEFAKAMVASSLGDMEVEEPATVVIGEFLRNKLESSR
jgi:hypothetical protein